MCWFESNRGSAYQVGAILRVEQVARLTQRALRGVAQSGQSSGLQNRVSRVQILPPLPSLCKLTDKLEVYETSIAGSNPARGT